MRRASLAACALLLALAAPAAAQDSTIVIRGFDTELRVNADGTLDVTEFLHLAFRKRWNGIRRDISLRHFTSTGRRETLDLEVVAVTDGAGRPLRVDREDDDPWLRRLKIWIPGAHDAERDVVIRYRVRNAVRFYFAEDTVPAFDEIYWNATGNDWELPIERATARVVLPGTVRPTRLAVYTGYEGDTARDADIRVDSARGIVTFTARRRLEPGEGMTVAAGWPPGAIATRPTEAQVRRAEALRLWPLGLPLVVFLVAFRAWRRRGRDPRAQSIVVQYEPPDGMSPAELGTLVDHEAAIRDVVSTLVDLAVRGYVGIEEREEKALLGLVSHTGYVFHLRRPRGEWDALAEHERRFLDALFRRAESTGAAWDEIRATFAEAQRAHAAGGTLDRDAVSARLARAGTRPVESVAMAELRNRFYKDLPGIREAIYQALIDRGYYIHRPDEVKGNWVGAGIALMVVGLGGAAFADDGGWGWLSTGALIAGVMASTLVLFVFAALMPARTPAGARAREAALGFREFLKAVESDRYRRMITSPELFERYLPHAMAFGVEERWARAFDDLYREPPDWYSGGRGAFRTSRFTSNMSTMTSRAGSAMASSPRSSGSGGGGSSGGGSGGGGGGGF